MVVLQINYFGILSGEPERDSPIRIDFHGPVTFELALQRMKFPPRSRQLLRVGGRIECDNNSPNRGASRALIPDLDPFLKNCSKPLCLKDTIIAYGFPRLVHLCNMCIAYIYTGRMSTKIYRTRALPVFGWVRIVCGVGSLRTPPMRDQTAHEWGTQDVSGSNRTVQSCVT